MFNLIKCAGVIEDGKNNLAWNIRNDFTEETATTNAMQFLVCEVSKSWFKYYPISFRVKAGELAVKL